MKRELPQIVKDAQRVRLALEQAFIRMARRHKYRTGVEICAAAKQVTVLALTAWEDRENRLVRAQELDQALRVLKLDLQLAQEIGAFGSWREFEAIARLVEGLGRQSGGWLRGLKPKGQNEQASPAQRAQKLSSRSAQAFGANP